MSRRAASPPRLCLEFGQGTFRALAGDDGLEVPLERMENGRMTAASREALLQKLRQFLQGRGASQRAICAINSWGVAMRKLSLPATPPAELESVVRLQMEREFPLAPEDLAWGFCNSHPLSAEETGSGPAATEVLVYAVKKEVVQEYAELLGRCGLKPTFTLSATALAALGPDPLRPHTVLEAGSDCSELIHCVEGVPCLIRLLPWGVNGAAPAVSPSPPAQSGMAATVSPSSPETDASVEANGAAAFAGDGRVGELVQLLGASAAGQKLYLTGAMPGLPELARELSRALGNGASCEALPLPVGPGRSPVTLGLSAWGSALPLRLHVPEPAASSHKAAPAAPWRWAVFVVGLAIAAVGLRYAEALIQAPRLARKLASLKTYQQQMPQMERELAFLQYLRTNQPPYLDSLATLAGAAPPGFRVESLSLNRRGDLALKATMRDPQQFVEFRAKLIRSGRFASVVLDEQTPSADQQKLTVRMSAQWRSTPEPTVVPSNAAAREPELPGPPGGRSGASATGNAAPAPAPAPESKPMPTRNERRE